VATAATATATAGMRVSYVQKIQRNQYPERQQRQATNHGILMRLLRHIYRYITPAHVRRLHIERRRLEFREGHIRERRSARRSDALRAENLLGR